MAQNPLPTNPTALPARRPLLRAVEADGRTFSLYPSFVQFVDEAVVFNNRIYLPDDEWIGAVLFPNDLGISFAERIADIPAFVSEVQVILGCRIDRVTGIAAEALSGDPPLLGDWIKMGVFDQQRFIRKFEQVLGGSWRINYNIRSSAALTTACKLKITRFPGT